MKIDGKMDRQSFVPEVFPHFTQGAHVARVLPSASRSFFAVFEQKRNFFLFFLLH